MKSTLKIVYMGTPDFAVAPLKKLIETGHNIVGVVTNIDKPAGRGKKLQESAVKQFAIQHNLLLLQPEKLKSEDFISQLKNLNADLFIVVAFRMLPKVVWEIPRIGTFNLHASLLPQYRGAAPINWAVVNGEKKSGVTTFFINENIDTGNILLQKEVSISDTESAGDLHDKLMNIGANLVTETVDSLENNSVKEIKQTALIKDSILNEAPKISKTTCQIDWKKDSISIYNHIRGFSPYPAAWTKISDSNKTLVVKILESTYEVETHTNKIGTIISNKDSIKIACLDGYILPTTIQIEGKKKMSIKDCLLGFSFDNFTIQ